VDSALGTFHWTSNLKTSVLLRRVVWLLQLPYMVTNLEVTYTLGSYFTIGLLWGLSPSTLKGWFSSPHVAKATLGTNSFARVCKKGILLIVLLHKKASNKNIFQKCCRM